MKREKEKKINKKGGNNERKREREKRDRIKKKVRLAFQPNANRNIFWNICFEKSSKTIFFSLPSKKENNEDTTKNTTTTKQSAQYNISTHHKTPGPAGFSWSERRSLHHRR